jgi:hypothetical protein
MRGAGKALGHPQKDLEKKAGIERRTPPKKTVALV